MKQTTLLSACTLLVGIAALVTATAPFVAVIGKLAIALSLVAFVATLAAYWLTQSFAAHVRRNDEFDWSLEPNPLIANDQDESAKPQRQLNREYSL